MRALALTVVLFACGNDPGMGDDTIGTKFDAPPLSGTLHKLTWGPLTIPSNTEGTKCIDVRLDNATEIKVHQMHNTLFPGSHHLIVYKNDKDTTERTTPYDCQPFTGALNSTGMIAPMMITQRSDDPLTLPDTVGYTLAANQMIRLEMHYNNRTDTDLDAMATVEFYEAPAGTVTQEANILFIGSPDIHLTKNSMGEVHQFFTPSRAPLDLTQAKFFAITGHTHHYGTDVYVKAGPKGGTLKDVYHPNMFQWAEPETTYHSPEFSIPDGEGFDFDCKYNNTSGQDVGFGESTEDEMCFFWAYYYPSKGAFVCVHSDDYAGVDICCPGNQLCSQIGL